MGVKIARIERRVNEQILQRLETICCYNILAWGRIQEPITRLLGYFIDLFYLKAVEGKEMK